MNNPMNLSKRQWLLGTATAVLAFAVASGAHAADTDMQSAPSIVKSLSKDIVLDRNAPANAPASTAPAANGNQATPARPAVAARPGPAVNLQVQFAFNSAELEPAGRRQLDELGKALNHKSLSTWGFELTGHTDKVGSAEYNLKLSLERANAVKHYLMVKHGINPARLIPLGLGFSQLANPAQPTAAINRRVEVRRVRLDAVGTAPASPAQHAPANRPIGGRLVPTP